MSETKDLDAIPQPIQDSTHITPKDKKYTAGPETETVAVEDPKMGFIKFIADFQALNSYSPASEEAAKNMQDAIDTILAIKDINTLKEIPSALMQPGSIYSKAILKGVPPEILDGFMQIVKKIINEKIRELL